MITALSDLFERFLFEGSLKATYFRSDTVFQTGSGAKTPYVLQNHLHLLPSVTYLLFVHWQISRTIANSFLQPKF